jgi:hypothetical protein
MKDPNERIMTNTMRRVVSHPILRGLAAGVILATVPLLAGAAQAQTKKQPKAQTSAAETYSDKKPNILFIMGDDIGWMQPSIYHRGLMVGETPHRNLGRDEESWSPKRLTA